MITFDDAGGAYLGTLDVASGIRIITSKDTVPAESMEWGGWAGGAVVVPQIYGHGFENTFLGV